MCDHVSTSMYNATVTETVGDTAGDNGFPLWLNWLRVPGLAHGLVYGLYGTLIGFSPSASFPSTRCRTCGSKYGYQRH
eukprot:m.188190 g.188190  ORF g.188190 m.188190 type:complete len:78 (-) comp17319_c0_seq1:830-1063(-)